MQRLLAVLVSFCLIASGCASLQGVPLPKPSVPAAVSVGEHVDITTRSGEHHAFKVTRVTDDAIEGEQVRVAYADMMNLQVRRADPGKTRTAIWITVGVVAALLALSLLALDEGGGALAGGSP